MSLTLSSNADTDFTELADYSDRGLAGEAVINHPFTTDACDTGVGKSKTAAG
jgi:hypothetical protein